MTPAQVAIAKALGRASLPIGTAAKRFAGQMAYVAEHDPAKVISDKQDTYLRQLAYKFRRQVPEGLLDDGAKKPFSILQWMAPELARQGLLRNEDWVTRSADEADAMFPNQAMKACAVMLAVLHPRAIEYINQAPVIIAGIMQGSSLFKKREREQVCSFMRPLIERGPKLREIMDKLKVPYQLRTLSSTALAPSRWPAIQMLNAVDPSTLAQSIPSTSGRQITWLRGLTSWEAVMSGRLHRPGMYATWAAMHIGTEAGDFDAADLADFAGSRGAAFNTSWSLQQARAAADRWHAELAAKSEEEGFFARNGLKWTDPIDYGKLPVEFECDSGLKIKALRSGEDIFLEGRAMRHCVASYTQGVVNGSCRLFSVRDANDRRLATFEFVVVAADDWHRGPWQLQQIKGPCNANPSLHVKDAAFQFMKFVNKTALMTALA